MPKSHTGIHVLRISLDELEPEIWRRVAIPSHFSLRKVHEVIQVVMPWTNSHLHEFIIDDIRYSHPKSKEFPEVKDSSKVDLQTLLPRHRSKAEYVYDFGDSWIHEIFVEAISRAQEGALYPLCLDGDRACPPEDCGGPPGFFDYLEESKVLGHPKQHEALDWRNDFDPKRFNIDEINARLRKAFP